MLHTFQMPLVNIALNKTIPPILEFYVMFSGPLSVMKSLVFVTWISQSHNADKTMVP